jgi:2-polyprenyl-3-methyl-5-hydroxy-6-metoxy-1,4-benzoquinol methylase
MTTQDGSVDPYLNEQLDGIRQYVASHEQSHRRLRRINRFFRNEIANLISSQIPRNSSVLDLGCGDSLLLSTSRASVAVGIDIASIESVDVNNESITVPVLHESSIEEFEFESLGIKFEYIVLSGVLEHVYDILNIFNKVRDAVDGQSRVLIVTYSRLWQPLLRLAERLKLKAALPTQNWVPVSEIQNLGEQAGFELIKTQRAILIPFYIPFVSRWVNKWLAPLPIIRQFTFAHLTVLRPIDMEVIAQSVSIVIAARNESGNIKALLDRMPKVADRQEIVFVEGNSTDDTWQVIQHECWIRAQGKYPHVVKAIQQPGRGKGDAVRAGFSQASGDIFIILDADISVPPEELPRFIQCITSGKAEFVNGSRLVYGMEGGAMRFLNLLGNRFFGSLFSFLLGQPVRDTLCGTKALSRHNYLRIVENRNKFGDFDPFGDFDLLFGASALNLKIRDQPVHYKARTYGETNISRFRHGWLLIRMSRVAASKVKFI